MEGAANQNAARCRTRKLREAGQDQEGRRVAGDGGAQPAAPKTLKGTTELSHGALAPTPHFRSPPTFRSTDRAGGKPSRGAGRPLPPVTPPSRFVRRPLPRGLPFPLRDESSGPVPPRG